MPFIFRVAGRRSCTPAFLLTSLLIVGCLPGRAIAGGYVAKLLFQIAAPYPLEPQVEFAGGGRAVGQEFQSSIRNDNGQAFLWTAAGAVSLQPANTFGFGISTAVATDGVRQVGYGGNSPAGLGGDLQSDMDHALVWTGTAASVVDLNPTNPALGIVYSAANGIGGSQIVGVGALATNTDVTQAVVWSGTAASAIDIHPPGLGFDSSTAAATDGVHQVGSAFDSDSDTFLRHAVLWTGTAASGVDLNPTGLGLSSSAALGVGGTQQVGYGFTDGPIDSVALVWTGSADSAVNLNPTVLGFDASQADATNGTQQVGYASHLFLNYDQTAMVWSGTAASAVDLQSLLPDSADWINSVATSIDPAGDIYGYAEELNGGDQHYAVEWIPVPEPSTSGVCCLVTILATGIRGNPSRKRQQRYAKHGRRSIRR